MKVTRSAAICKTSMSLYLPLLLICAVTILSPSCVHAPFYVNYQSDFHLGEPLPYKTRLEVVLPDSLPRGVDSRSIVKAVTDDLASSVFSERAYDDAELVATLAVRRFSFREGKGLRYGITVPGFLATLGFGVVAMAMTKTDNVTWPYGVILTVLSPLIPWPWTQPVGEAEAELTIQSTDGATIKRYAQSEKVAGTALTFWSGKDLHISRNGGVAKDALRKALEKIKRDVEFDRGAIVSAIKRMEDDLPVTGASSAEPPKLTFDCKIADYNESDGMILTGGSKVTLDVTVRNTGAGTARGVSVVLAGSSRLLDYFPRLRPLGNIAPGAVRAASFEAALPNSIQPDNASLKVRVTEINGFDALEEKELVIAMQPAKVQRQTQVVSTLVDVDAPLEPSGFARDDAYAVVIGISGYRQASVPKVAYARKDAEAIRDYLVGACGFRAENIKTLLDDGASKSDLEAYCEEWLARNVRKGSFVFVYFAGHGTPSPDKGEAYIVPYDGEPGFVSKLYPLSRLYSSLAALPTDQVVVALDACFSGAGGRSVMEQGKRPLVAVDLEKEAQKLGNVAVLAASAGNEISQDYGAKRHGLFTYYLLKGLRGEADIDKDGWVTVKELYNYAKPKVLDESQRLGYTQTLQLLPPGAKSTERVAKAK